ncbi:MAG: type II toxin-antitoxin system VapC family toxin [Hyphomicrobiales bacterium]
MFIDTSAIIAILRQEPEEMLFLSRIERADHVYTSPVVVLETVMRLSTLVPCSVEKAKLITQSFLSEIGAHITPVTEHTADHAIDAFARYGKGQGHPAQLNLGDCFSYAAAKESGVALLYKGDDFLRTDLA